MRKICFKASPVKKGFDLVVEEKKKIGEGQFGKVCYAQDSSNPQLVFALKSLSRKNIDENEKLKKNLF